MISIVDYGMGNLRSVQKAFELFSPQVKISASPDDILLSDKIVLPGVGAFGKAMDELRKRGLVEAIIEFVNNDKPFLGVCLGLQLLFTESEEGGRVEGLDVLKGRVLRFKDVNGLKVPHMGWNQIKLRAQGSGLRLLDGVTDGAYMYFVHSYYVEPEDKDAIFCTTDYGIEFTSGVQKENIYAFQFHPEKSQTTGLKIIKNFVNL